MNADFLAFPLREVDQLRRNRESAGLFEQRPELSAKGTPGNVRAAPGVFYDWIVRTADFKRAFPRADVQTGFAVQVAFQDELANQLQFGVRGVRTHVFSSVPLFVVRHDGFEEIAE